LTIGTPRRAWTTTIAAIAASPNTARQATNAIGSMPVS